MKISKFRSCFDKSPFFRGSKFRNDYVIRRWTCYVQLAIFKSDPRISRTWHECRYGANIISLFADSINFGTAYVRFIERAPLVLPALVTFHFVSNATDQNHNLSISIARAWIWYRRDSVSLLWGYPFWSTRNFCRRLIKE